MRKLKFAFCLTIAIAAVSASFAAETHQSAAAKAQRGVGSTAAPSHNAPYVVPYTCGNNVSSIYNHNSLVVKSDQNGDAGYELYSSQTTPIVPFAPGVLSFNINGAKNGDALGIVETDVNGHTNGNSQPVFISNGSYSVNLSTFTNANIERLGCVIFTTNSTIILSNFQLASKAISLDVTQTAHCSSQR